MNEAQTLSVTLRLDEAMRDRLSASETVMDVIREYVVDSPEMAQAANGEIQSIKKKIEEIEAVRVGFVKPARDIIEHAQAIFDPALKALREAEQMLKFRLGDWTLKQQRLADEARRARDEQERRIRQEAEAKAAAERARAEQEASEKRRQAAEQEEIRKKAELDGNAKVAAKAAADGARLEEEARSRQQQGDLRASEHTLSAAAAISSAPAVVEPAKVDGFSMRDNWQVELDGAENDVVKTIAGEIVGTRVDKSGNFNYGAPRPELVGLLKLDLSAANRMAKALKGVMNVPGLRAVNKPTPVSRK